MKPEFTREQDNRKVLLSEIPLYGAFCLAGNPEKEIIYLRLDDEKFIAIDSNLSMRRGGMRMSSFGIIQDCLVIPVAIRKLQITYFQEGT